jgi:hypothetical protein
MPHALTFSQPCPGLNATAGVVKAVLLGNASQPDAFGVQTVTSQLWSDTVRTITPPNTVEEWDIINLTPDGEMPQGECARVGWLAVGVA